MRRTLPSAWRCCCASFWKTGPNPEQVSRRLLSRLHPPPTQLFVSGRDRVSCVWQTVRDHLYHLCVHATESCFLVERAVVGLLRLAIRLLRREDISSQVDRAALTCCACTCTRAVGLRT